MNIQDTSIYYNDTLKRYIWFWVCFLFLQYPLYSEFTLDVSNDIMTTIFIHEGAWNLNVYIYIR